jgi:hypothetical protein
VHVTVEALRALRDKYREIKRLRDEHARGEAGDPKPAMVALARRFPGALRELDELPMPMIAERLALLEAALEDGAPPPEWARLQIGYHGLMRAVLRIKRLLARRGAGGPPRAGVARAYVPAPDEPPLSAFDAAALDAIARPVDGRLNPWVFERVAEACGVPADAVRRALFLR